MEFSQLSEERVVAIAQRIALGEQYLPVPLMITTLENQERIHPIMGTLNH
jgi:hypothetical protein